MLDHDISKKVMMAIYDNDTRVGPPTRNSQDPGFEAGAGMQSIY
jgi:hypothetical protein